MNRSQEIFPTGLYQILNKKSQEAIFQEIASLKSSGITDLSLITDLINHQEEEEEKGKWGLPAF